MRLIAMAMLTAAMLAGCSRDDYIMWVSSRPNFNDYSVLSNDVYPSKAACEAAAKAEPVGKMPGVYVSCFPKGVQPK